MNSPEICRTVFNEGLVSRALVMNPKLILLVEPAAGMNQGEIGELIDLVRWVKDEFSVTIWIIEHQMRVIMNIVSEYRCSILDRRSLKGHLEIRNNPKVIQAYLGEEVA